MPSAARLWLADEFVRPEESFLRRRNLGRVFDDAGAAGKVDDFFPTFARHVSPAGNRRFDSVERQLKYLIFERFWVGKSMGTQGCFCGFRLTVKECARAREGARNRRRQLTIVLDKIGTRHKNFVGVIGQFRHLAESERNDHVALARRFGYLRRRWRER